MQNIKPNRPQGYTFVPQQQRKQRLYRSARGELVDLENLQQTQADQSKTLSLTFDYDGGSLE